VCFSVVFVGCCAVRRAVCVFVCVVLLNDDGYLNVVCFDECVCCVVE